MQTKNKKNRLFFSQQGFKPVNHESTARVDRPSNIFPVSICELKIGHDCSFHSNWPLYYFCFCTGGWLCYWANRNIATIKNNRNWNKFRCKCELKLLNTSILIWILFWIYSQKFPQIQASQSSSGRGPSISSSSESRRNTVSVNWNCMPGQYHISNSFRFYSFNSPGEEITKHRSPSIWI